MRWLRLCYPAFKWKWNAFPDELIFRISWYLVDVDKVCFRRSSKVVASTLPAVNAGLFRKISSAKSRRRRAVKNIAMNIAVTLKDFLKSPLSQQSSI